MLNVLYFLVTLAGVLAHFLKKKVNGETVSDIKEYFQTHFKSTVLMLMAAIVLFMTAVNTGEIGWVTSFTIGYTADSLFNKSAGDI